jgi:hypothetical protein
VEKSIAAKVLETIATRYNPTERTPINVRQRNLDHTPQRIKQNKNKDITKEARLYDPNIHECGHPLNLARIYCLKQSTKKRRVQNTDLLPPAYKMVNDDEEEGNEYIDVNSKSEKDERIRLIKILNEDKNNNLEITMKYKDNVTSIFERLKDWEDKNWINVINKEQWQKIAYLLQSRGAKTCFKLDKGLASANDEETEQEIVIPEEWKTDGVRLSGITQKDAYNHCRIWKSMEPKSKRAVKNIEEACKALQTINGSRPKENMIWKHMYKVQNKKIGDFIWKMIHEKNACGQYFANIPGWDDKKYCECGSIEDMEHILFTCKKSTNDTIWTIAEQTWLKITNTPWIRPVMGIIYGVGAISLKGKRSATTDLYKTLITTTIWIIWKDRNNRRINNEKMDITETTEKWKDAIKNEVLIETHNIQVTPLKKRGKVRTEFLEK